MDGILIVNKPKGYTSHDVISKLRKILKTKQIGHVGTLDPNATGVLLLLIGKATKISKYLMEHDKTYIAELTLGEQKSTGDIEGETISKKEVKKELLIKENINEKLQLFLGKQFQKPPIYSSVKVNGKKLYEYARTGESVEIPIRQIEIYSIDLLETVENKIRFKVKCSKGTYIRTLCEDIAKKLETVGYMSNLDRIKVDEFDISQSLTLEQIELNKEFVNENLVSVEEAFKDNLSIKLNEKDIKLFLNGVMLTNKNIDGLYKIYNGLNEFIGLGLVKDNLLKRDVVLKG